VREQYLNFSDFLKQLAENEKQTAEFNCFVEKRLTKLEKGLELLGQIGKESGETAQAQGKQLAQALEKLVDSTNEQLSNSKTGLRSELRRSLGEFEGKLQLAKASIPRELTDTLGSIERRLEPLNENNVPLDFGSKIASNIETGLGQLEKQLRGDISQKIAAVEEKLNALPGAERDEILKDKVGELINARLASTESAIQKKVQVGLENIEGKLASLEGLRSDVKANEKVRKMFDEEVLTSIDVKLSEEKNSIKGELDQKLAQLEDRISCLFDVAVQQEKDVQDAGEKAGESLVELVDARLTATEDRLHKQMAAKLKELDQKLAGFDDKLNKGAESIEQFKWVQEEKKTRESIDDQIRGEVQKQLVKMKTKRDPRMMRLKNLAAQAKKKRLIQRLLEDEEDDDL